MSRSWQRIVATAAVLALVLMGWRALSSDPPAATAEPRAAATPAMPVATSGQPSGALSRPLDEPAREQPSRDLPTLEDAPEGSPLAVYLKNSVYPPRSRPLTESNQDLIDWNRRYETRTPTHADADVSFLFTADKYRIIGDEPVTATLQAWRDDQPIPVQVTAAFVAPYGADGSQPGRDSAIPLTSASHDDLISVTVRVGDVPGLQALDRPTMLGVFVEFDYAGQARQRASLRVLYTPAGRVPARFTGNFREAIEDGSLVIYAELDVFEPGVYLIDANLYDVDDRPVAWTRDKREFDAGMTEARLLLFGKIFADSRAPGPYRLGQLRGVRVLDNTWPDTEQIMPFQDSYETEAYDLAVFSSRAWDSDRKRDMIRRLEAASRNPGGPFVFTPPAP